MQLIIDMSELPDSVSGIISKKLQREKEEGYRPCFDQTNLTAEMPPYIRGVSGKITAVLFDKPLDRIGRKYDPGPEGPVDAILKTAHPHKPISEQPVTPAQARAEFLDTIRTTTSRYLGMLASLKALDDEEMFQKIFGSDD